MSLQENLSTFTYQSMAAAAQYRAVAISATAPRSVAYPALGGVVIGTTLNDATAAGQALTVANGGILKVEASAPIALGANVAAAADGRAITAVATNSAFGKAITAAAAAGEIIEVAWLGPWTV